MDGESFSDIRESNNEFIRETLQWAIATKSKRQSARAQADLDNISWLENFSQDFLADDPVALAHERRRSQLLLKLDSGKYVAEMTAAVEFIVPNGL